MSRALYNAAQKKFIKLSIATAALVGLASPADMIKSNGRKYYPGLALLETHS